MVIPPKLKVFVVWTPMFTKRVISRFIWIFNEYIARFIVFTCDKKVSVKELEVNFSNKRIMVISPHSDDESIGCFGIICQLEICPYYWLLCGGDEKRVKEWREAISEMSPKNDQKMLISNEQDGMFSDCSDRIYNDLICHLEKYKIDYVFCPSFYDDHPDHRVISQQVLKALSEGFIKETYFYQTNYPVIFDKRLFKLEISKDIRKKKFRAYKIFNSQNRHLDFAILARYQNYVSWLTKSKYCEFFFKVDSAAANQIIGKLLKNHSYNCQKKTSILNVKSSFLNILRTLQ